MDYTKTDFWIALAIGGSLCAVANVGLQLTKKQTEDSKGFNGRSVVRDFCIGAFLAATVFMFLPDSVSNFIAGLQSVGQSVSQASSAVTGGGESSSIAPPSDIELRLGPARF